MKVNLNPEFPNKYLFKCIPKFQKLKNYLPDNVIYSNFKILKKLAEIKYFLLFVNYTIKAWDCFWEAKENLVKIWKVFFLWQFKFLKFSSKVVQRMKSKYLLPYYIRFWTNFKTMDLFWTMKDYCSFWNHQRIRYSNYIIPILF